jgi:hypothetical protein
MKHFKGRGASYKRFGTSAPMEEHIWEHDAENVWLGQKMTGG